MDEILLAFIEDGNDHLKAMESGLLRLEEGDADADTLNAIFRAAHTIKGDAGVVDLGHIEQFAHTLENYFQQLRSGELEVSRPLVTLLLRGCDHIKTLFAELVEGKPEPGKDLQDIGASLAAQLRSLMQGGQGGAEAAATHAHQRSVDASALTECWQIVVRFGPDLLRKGIDPYDVLAYLGSKGEIVRVITLTDRLPDASHMDPQVCYLGFEVHLRSSLSKQEIEQAFEIVRSDCELQVLPPGSQVGTFIQSIQTLPEESMRLGEMLVKSNALTSEELDEGLELLKSTADGAANPQHLGEILVGRHMVQPEIVEAAAARQQQVNEKKVDEARQIRVQAEKLDMLVDLVGEMVISSASANLMAQNSGRGDLIEANYGLSRLIERMRDLSLQLRMVQIGDTFTRFKRVVRDMAREMNREIELNIRGAETELDKSIVEKIGDPLMHLVRNAIDHGIEPAEARLASGKPAAGQLELNAYHETGGIVIEVADDGAGLDKDRILAKAIERGLVVEGQALSDQEIHDLIFVPGFSTADKVTKLSGRGVGMDVVRANISALRGSVEVLTERGSGSRFVIRLPLTMAIIDGFLVGVGKSQYVIPLEAVMECLEFEEAGAARDYINLRGEVLPFVNLRSLFGAEGESPERENVVIVRSGRNRAGIIVDNLLGELQTVIKPMSTVFRNLRGVAGSTILGNGEVALILDIPALMRLARDTEERSVCVPGQQQAARDHVAVDG
ncbi:MAG: chemotaxis protein CheA [Sterolibacterium sp.]